MAEAPTAGTRPHVDDELTVAPLTGRAWWDGGGVWLALTILLVVAAARFPNTPVTGFTFDTGLQMNLARLTAEGAVPLRDFEHGWNAGSWYFGAALWRLVGGSPGLWWYAFTVGGQLLAGVAVLSVIRNRGIGQLWMLVLIAGWLAGARVPHMKYAVPAVTLAVLVWGWNRSHVIRITTSIGMFAVLVVTHVELAVLLGAGLALYELAHAERASAERLLSIAAAPLGVLLGLGIQVMAYAAIGVAPAEVLRQLVGDQTVIDPANHFGYPLLGTSDIRTTLVPVLLLIPFLPAVWSSLHRVTRLTACLQLALIAIALRRTDSSHVAAATTLLPLLVGLVVLDVQPRLAAVRATGSGRVLPLWWLAGALTIGLGVAVAFTAQSLLGIAVLFLAAIAGIAAARWASPAAGPASTHGPVSVQRASRTASATLGGIAAAAALLIVSLIGGIATADSVAGRDTVTAALAGPVSQPLADCTAGDDAVWIVPHPLGLYSELGLTNPTPFVMFHYPFVREHGRVMAMVDAGQVPTILTYGGWLPSFEGLDVQLEEGYHECARLDPPVVPEPVRILRWNGLLTD